MPFIKFEETPTGPAELALANALQDLCRVSNMSDCRNLAPTVRMLAEKHLCNMVTGCGGSHIYIHREHEFVVGQPAHENNRRWAIITDTEA